MLKYVVAWLPLLLLAVLNGALREGVYAESLGELRAHQVSTLTGVLLFGLYMWVLFRVWKPASSRQAIAIGLVWLAMTATFEFLFMHYDYNIFEGRAWVVVLLWVMTAPYLFYRLQK